MSKATSATKQNKTKQGVSSTTWFKDPIPDPPSGFAHISPFRQPSNKFQLQDVVHVHRTPKVAGAKAAAVVAVAIRAAMTFMLKY